MAMLGFTCTVLVTWEVIPLWVSSCSVLVCRSNTDTSQQHLYNRTDQVCFVHDLESELIGLRTRSGGSAGFIYSYIFSFAGSLSLFTVMGEMASL